MRPWPYLFTALFVFATLHACKDDAPSGPGPRVASDAGGPDAKPETEDGGEPTPDAAPPSKGMNTTNEMVDVDGAIRAYVLSVPTNYDPGRSYPLILALHGDGQDAKGFVSFSKLEAQTGDEAILAYPDQSVDLMTPYEDNPDQKLIERVIDVLAAKYSIDATKIWGFGYSKGAYQLNEIACKKPGLLTAMAVHAGGAPQSRDGDDNVDCPDAIGLPAFITHGADDQPGGGEYEADYWASRAGCQASRSPTEPDICEAYDGCNPGEPVVFCVVPNQPHYPMYGDAAAHSWAWFKSL